VKLKTVINKKGRPVFGMDSALEMCVTSYEMKLLKITGIPMCLL